MVRISSLRIPRGRNFWAWPPVVLALALVTTLLVVSAGRIAWRARAITAERRALGERVLVLTAEVERLKRAITELEASAAVERLAKGQLNLKVPGEQVVIIREDARATVTPQRVTGWPRRFLPGWLAELILFLRR